MALVIGHNRINYLWDSLKEYTVFSFPEYKTLDSLKEEEIYQVAPFFSVSTELLPSYSFKIRQKHLDHTDIKLPSIIN